MTVLVLYKVGFFTEEDFDKSMFMITIRNFMAAEYPDIDPADHIKWIVAALFIYGLLWPITVPYHLWKSVTKNID